MGPLLIRNIYISEPRIFFFFLKNITEIKKNEKWKEKTFEKPLLFLKNLIFQSPKCWPRILSRPSKQTPAERRAASPKWSKILLKWFHRQALHEIFLIFRLAPRKFEKRSKHTCMCPCKPNKQHRLLGCAIVLLSFLTARPMVYGRQGISLARLLGCQAAKLQGCWSAWLLGSFFSSSSFY